MRTEFEYGRLVAIMAKSLRCWIDRRLTFVTNLRSSKNSAQFAIKRGMNERPNLGFSTGLRQAF